MEKQPAAGGKKIGVFAVLQGENVKKWVKKVYPQPQNLVNFGKYYNPPEPITEILADFNLKGGGGFNINPVVLFHLLVREKLNLLKYFLNSTSVAVCLGDGIFIFWHVIIIILSLGKLICWSRKILRPSGWGEKNLPPSSLENAGLPSDKNWPGFQSVGI